VGVHQDGLVHVSELADHFVKDPHAVVKVGDKLTVRVLAVDLERKRISLSAKRGKTAQAKAETSATAHATNDARQGQAGSPQGRARQGQSAQGERAPQRPPQRPGPAQQGRSPQGGDPGRGPRDRQAPAQQPFKNNPFADLLKKS
jgi:uncharacterized protein